MTGVDARSFRLAYDPAATGCRCGQVMLPAVHAELDEKPVCDDCLAGSSWSHMHRVADALDTLDVALAEVEGTDEAIWSGEDIRRIVLEMIGHRVPDGLDDDLPDAVFRDELLRRVSAADLSPEHTLAILARLLPGTSWDDLQAHLDRLSARAARAEAGMTEPQAGIKLLARFPAGTTTGAAVAQLGIDWSRYLGAVTRIAAERGCSVGELEWDAITEAIEAAKVEGGGRS